jgi:hypothetical protein
MRFRRFRMSLIFWLLAPIALTRRFRHRPSGWVEAGRER